jgi:uncharacterized membrane protein
MMARLLFAVTATGLAAAALAAPCMAAIHPLAALAVRSFFAPVCDQNPVRSFFLDGSPLAVCVRCLGIYCGIATGAWQDVVLGARLRAPRVAARHLFFAALSLNIIDVVAETLHLHGNLPVPRFMFGVALGLAVGVLLCSRQESAAAL